MTRIVTAVIGLPLVVAVTYGGPDWLFASVVALVAAIAFDEFLEISSSSRAARTGRWFLPFGAAVALSFSWGNQWVVGTLTMTMILAMTLTLSTPVSMARERITGSATGLIYTCVFPGFLILLSREAVLVLLGIVWAGDMGAYYGGRTLGRRPLAPRISPHKTVEGAIAGGATSLVAGVALARLLAGETNPLFGGGLVPLTVVILVTAVAGQLGDLAESALKRSAGVKDSSSLLPGHGGMLDRIDGLLFAAPMFYFLTLL
jgi:phosphatidate cytidylyltransferase